MRVRLLAAAAGIAALLGTTPLAAAPDNFDQAERGRYLVILGDCAAFHMNPNGTARARRDSWAAARSRRPSARSQPPTSRPTAKPASARGPRTTFAAPCTRASAPTARLYPGFPYTYFTRMPRGDTDAIFAYFNTLEPVRNPVDRNTLPFPFNIRASMLAWNALFFEPGEFRPDPNRSAEWNRGAYIVERPAHCGACHTPKNLLGVDCTSQRFGGGPLQGWYATNLTTEERTGVGSWSVEEIAEYLKNGRNARSAASGPMAEVVEYSTALMTDADLRAIAVYLKEPPGAAPAPPARTALAATDERMRTGEAIYLDRCIACHTRSGEGVPRMFPRLAGSQVVQQEGSETVLRVVLQGVRAAYSPHAPTSPAVPAFGWRLDDEQTAAVTTYIRNAWGNAAPAVTAGEAAQMRERVRDRP
ncbi:c-type cytochrome [Roseomonas sp. GCM10028921]